MFGSGSPCICERDDEKLMGAGAACSLYRVFDAAIIVEQGVSRIHHPVCFVRSAEFTTGMPNLFSENAACRTVSHDCMELIKRAHFCLLVLDAFFGAGSQQETIFVCWLPIAVTLAEPNAP